MRVLFRAPTHLLRSIRDDLRRPHMFAAERVGFLACRPAKISSSGILVLAQRYFPVADDDYLVDQSVGAMMGPAAIRKALQISLTNETSMFHIHMHEHRGKPRFSGIDTREARSFIPDFFNVTPSLPHGAIVLSHDAMSGLCWLTKAHEPLPFAEMWGVGSPLRSFRCEI
jgi:hypothetical protein